MKKSKGMTLVELIVSLALLSIVMVFMFSLLVNLKEEEGINSTQPSFKIMATVINRNLQSAILQSNIDYISNCSANVDNTSRCLLIELTNGNLIQLTVSNNNQVVTVVETKNGVVKSYERRQLPEKSDSSTYLGEVGEISVEVKKVNKESSYDYSYDAILSIRLPLIDSKKNEYWIEAYYPYLYNEDNLIVSEDGFTL